MAALEKKTGKGFGSGDNPLLVSVRSGSAMSMPGMMDTILNLGLNETSLQGLIKQTGNERFAYDAYRRFIQLFGKIALGIADEHFDERMAAIKRKYGAPLDVDLDAEHLKALAGEFLAIVEAPHRQAFPAGPVRAARDLGRRGVPLLDGQARGGLPQAVQDHQGAGQWHRGQHLHHGVRQHGQRFRHRRGLHAQSRHRRERDLRRVPDQRPGRGRGGGHPHAQADRRDGTGNAGDLPPVDWNCTTGSSRITTKCRISSSPSRKARSTACRPATAR